MDPFCNGKCRNGKKTTFAYLKYGKVTFLLLDLC